MAEPARKRATYDDVLAAPKHVVAEIIDGELVLSPRPTPRHARSSSALGGKLFGPFDEGDGGPGGWWILDEPELHLDEHVLVPDLAGWKVERMPELPEAAYFALAPDWVCEVLSKSTEASDRADKLPIYAASGVSHAWLLNPIAQTLEVLRLELDRWLVLATYRGDATVRAEPFDAIELKLSLLWGRPAAKD